ncbi:MAG: PA14 domain-containing protein, partial [Planctomycetota bacterium]
MPSITRRSRVERLEERRVLAATSIEVLAAGLSGTEDVALEVDGVEVRRWENVGGDFGARQFQTLRYTHPTAVVAGDLAVRFVGGADSGSDLRIDGVRVDGLKSEAEATNTWSTGGWDNGLRAILPAFGEGSVGDEVLYARNGAFYFQSGTRTSVDVFAAGATNNEWMDIYIGDEFITSFGGIGGDYDNRVFQRYALSYNGVVAPEDVRVEFVNDQVDSQGRDYNLRVDAIAINGRRYETEAAGTFSTGTWTGTAIEPSFPEDERLQANGAFTYSRLGEDSTSDVGSRVIVYAAGRTGEEIIEVVGDGGVAATIAGVGGGYNNRDFFAYGAAHPRSLSLSDVAVRFTNDATSAAGDRNVRIDAIELDGVRHEAEAPTTFSTGTWKPILGVQPGFVQDERLHAKGSLQFGQDPAAAGVLSLAQTQYSVAEDGLFVDVEFVRTATRGAITLDYTTLDGSAVAGQDYVASSGVVVFADGQASRSVRVLVTNDGLSEGNETFNVAADRVTGGAFLGQPRTTTVTIVDDEVTGPGNGIGLLGEYFAGQSFGSLLLSRTDDRIDFDWGAGSPAPGVGINDFSVRWTGEVQPLYGETYTFEANTDDGVRLWVNGVQLIDQWVDQSETASSGQITLQAGQRYDIRMEYYENSGSAVAELRWSSPSQAKQLIPRTQ